MDRNTLDKEIECHLTKKLIEWWDTTEKDDAVTKDIIEKRITIDGYTLVIPSMPMSSNNTVLNGVKVNGNRIVEEITILDIGSPDTPSELIRNLKQKLNMHSMNSAIMSIVW